MQTLLTLRSGNTKVGPMPVSTTEQQSCPSTCPLRTQGCYAKGHLINHHWKRLSAKLTGIAFSLFLKRIANLPLGQLWRHNQAGDLAGKDTKIDTRKLKALTRANAGKRGFTYTHKPTLNHPHAEVNRQAVAAANTGGFTVNLSANNLDEADKYVALGIAPVVTLLPIGTPAKLQTPAGNTVILCPAQRRENLTCVKCKLCQIPKRKVIIGFEAHGYAKRIVSNITAYKSMRA